MMVGTAVVAGLHKRIQFDERAELASLSDAHQLLVPAFYDCYQDSFFEKAPSIGSCLARTVDIASELDLSDRFPAVKTDILAYEAVSK